MTGHVWQTVARTTFATLALGALGLVASACSDSAPREITASLFAPPKVPQPHSRTTSFVQVRLEAIEVEQEIAPGVTYDVWTFNGTVPGPLLRVHEGDTVEVTLKNSGSSTVTHNIDLHAVNGPGGGAGASTVAPGETKTFTFKALSAGLFTYHCAAGLVADHIANGMYGGILVEPKNGLPRVDHEFYIGQNDVYTDLPTGQTGKASLDIQKLLAEQPTYVLMNGHTQALSGNNSLRAKTGDTVRMYFVDGGPNLTSSFHVIGEIFDKAWPWGTLESLPVKGVQTISVPPGGAVIVEFKVDVPGDYKIVDHALGRVAKGAIGNLQVSGDYDDAIFGLEGGIPIGDVGGHDMETHAPEGAPIADGATVKVEMKDNAFVPNAFTTAPGSRVTFELPNIGKVPHNMRIAAGGNFDSAQSAVSGPGITNPGSTATLTWTAPAEAGAYKFRCDVHPTDMTGTITVK